MFDPLPPDFATTRESLHALAEVVLSAARHAAVGRVGLLPNDGGIATPPFGPHDTVLAVDAGGMSMTASGERRTAQVTTLRAAADFAGITPGVPAGLWRPKTNFALDEPLVIDPASMHALFEWYACVGAALVALIAGASPKPEIQLWPEDFDLAVRLGDDNYGGSPGDAHFDEPYLYVGATPRPTGEFWNASFGAARCRGELRSADELSSFFDTGRHLLAADRHKEATMPNRGHHG
jgi:hypothetical protein